MSAEKNGFHRILFLLSLVCATALGALGAVVFYQHDEISAASNAAGLKLAQIENSEQSIESTGSPNLKSHLPDVQSIEGNSVYRQTILGRLADQLPLKTFDPPLPQKIIQLGGQDVPSEPITTGQVQTGSTATCVAGDVKVPSEFLTILDRLKEPIKDVPIGQMDLPDDPPAFDTSPKPGIKVLGGQSRPAVTGQRVEHGITIIEGGRGSQSEGMSRENGVMVFRGSSSSR